MAPAPATAPPGPPPPTRRVLRAVNALAVTEWTAFFASYVVLGVYLTEVAGFGDVGAGWAAGAFGVGLCVLPSFAGAVADRLGFRRTLAGSYGLQAAGFAVLAVARAPLAALPGLALVAVGGAASRAALLGTIGVVEPDLRTRAYALFLQFLNVGCLLGKLAARPLRLHFGPASVEAFAAVAMLVSLALALAAFRDPPVRTPSGGGVRAVLRGMARVARDRRFVAMLVQIGLFWAVQSQMYATMPRYALRLAGADSAPEWYALVNSALVVAVILPVGAATAHWSGRRAITTAVALQALATALMGLGPWLVSRTGPAWTPWPGVAVSPFTAMFVAGAAVSGLAECFLVPRYLDRIARLAPPGQAALYQGYGYLNGLVANAVGWGLSGYLLDTWCPDPATIPGAPEALARAAAGLAPWPAPWDHAPVIFLGWAALAVATLALVPAWNRRETDADAPSGDA